jgi:hypothetical protein
MTEADLKQPVVRALAQCHWPAAYDKRPKETLQDVAAEVVADRSGGYSARRYYNALLALWEQAQREERARCREAVGSEHLHEPNPDSEGDTIYDRAITDAVEAIDNLPGLGA